ncbi:MAG: CPBP family intramembrane metalloprotease [Planctomycetota bacterium]|nr:MAG: CPBP family intramembrane metalloprotease [Planctomycetota bacterium]
MQQNSSSSTPSTNTILYACLLVYPPMALLALGWLYLQNNSLPSLWQHLWHKPIWNLLLGMGIGLIVVTLSQLSSNSLSWAKKMEERFCPFFANLTLKHIFLLALLSSIGEELFFRGAMQPVFGITLTSLIFGSLHILPPNEGEKLDIFSKYSWTIFAIAMGFLLGYMYEFSQNILAPISTHFWVNFLNMYFLSTKYTQNPQNHSTSQNTLKRREDNAT